MIDHDDDDDDNICMHQSKGVIVKQREGVGELFENQAERNETIIYC